MNLLAAPFCLYWLLMLPPVLARVMHFVLVLLLLSRQAFPKIPAVLGFL